MKMSNLEGFAGYKRLYVIFFSFGVRNIIDCMQFFFLFQVLGKYKIHDFLEKKTKYMINHTTIILVEKLSNHRQNKHMATTADDVYSFMILTKVKMSIIF